MTRHIANAATPVGLLDGVLRGPDWTGAACREIGDPALWFPTARGGRYDWGTARAICQQCPLRETCLEYAMRREGGYRATYRAGVWGGTTPIERQRLWDQRRKVRAA